MTGDARAYREEIMALTSLESTVVECFDCEWPLTEWGASTLPVTGEGEETRLAAQHADETGHEVEITTRLSVRKEG